MEKTIKCFGMIIAFATVIVFLLAGCAMLGFATTDGGTAGLVSARVKDGTYTFWPRPQATAGGLEQDGFIGKIVVQSGYFNVYMNERPRGDGVSKAGNTNWSGSAWKLVNLDRPSVVYEGVQAREDGKAMIISFQNVSGTRFSLTFEAYNPPYSTYEEFNLDDSLESRGVDMSAPAVRNGTYTFFPRPQAVRGSVEQEGYLDKIVVRSGYFNVYMTNRPRGDGVSRVGNANWSGSAWKLVDLDRPYIELAGVQSREDNALIISFENVSGTRFSLSFEAYDRPYAIYEEFNLADAEFE